MVTVARALPPPSAIYVLSTFTR